MRSKTSRRKKKLKPSLRIWIAAGSAWSVVAETLTDGVTANFGTPPLPPTGSNDTNSSTLSIDANGESE